MYELKQWFYDMSCSKHKELMKHNSYRRYPSDLTHFNYPIISLTILVRHVKFLLTKCTLSAFRHVKWLRIHVLAVQYGISSDYLLLYSQCNPACKVITYSCTRSAIRRMLPDTYIGDHVRTRCTFRGFYTDWSRMTLFSVRSVSLKHK